MTESKNKLPGETVECAVCLKEIPRSEARVEELEDYVAYFCGLDCYEKWKQSDSGSDDTKD